MDENVKNEKENEERGMSVLDFSQMLDNSQNKSNTHTNIITNIKDTKKLFNLENNVDELLNNCEGEMIRVKEVLIKRYLKPMKEPIVDEETGEVVKDSELSMSTVLIDDNGKSYATGSKIFGIQLLRYFDLLNKLGKIENENFEPFEIKIIKKEYKGTQNKCLSFTVV